MVVNMNIQGIQKLTLLDFPGKTSCTVFTGGCNFRCPFCHNATLVLNPTENNPITDEIFLDFLDSRKKLLDGVSITGGEPLLQKDIAEFCHQVKERGFAVKLDTNGTFPDVLSSLLENGLLDYVAMDIKNSFSSYCKTVGLASMDFEPIKKSISLLINSGITFEFRTTVVKELHSIDDFVEIADMIKGAKKYYLQSYKPSDNQIGGILSEPGYDFLRQAADLMISRGIDTEIRGIDM